MASKSGTRSELEGVRADGAMSNPGRGSPVGQMVLDPETGDFIRYEATTPLEGVGENTNYEGQTDQAKNYATQGKNYAGGTEGVVSTRAPLKSYQPDEPVEVLPPRGTTTPQSRRAETERIDNLYRQGRGRDIARGRRFRSLITNAVRSGLSDDEALQYARDNM